MDQQLVSVSGYGVNVSVKRGHLVVEDGIGKDRRSRRFNRVKPGIDRLVVEGHSGTVSLDALRWLRDVGAEFVQIDNDGTLITTSVPGHGAKSKLVHNQVKALTDGRALKIMRRLIGEKIEGQVKNLRWMGAKSNLIAHVEEHLRDVRRSKSFDQLRGAEGPAGKQYWRAWEGLPVRFRDRDQKKIPDHWIRFNRRRSPISEGNRKAIDPTNALLNYLFGILESEAHLAAMHEGFNPYIGLMHADYPFRPTLAMDLMEPFRPQVEREVLGFLSDRTFSAGEFFETREGNCRLVPPLTTEITESLYARVIGLRKLIKRVRRALM